MVAELIGAAAPVYVRVVGDGVEGIAIVHASTLDMRMFANVCAVTGGVGETADPAIM